MCERRELELNHFGHIVNKINAYMKYPSLIGFIISGYFPGSDSDSSNTTYSDGPSNDIDIL